MKKTTITERDLRDFGFVKSNDKVAAITKTPQKVKPINQPKMTARKRDDVHQIDILFLPNDNGYKYLLVVVDTATRLLDMEPLKSKEASKVSQALDKIYKRNILNKPFLLKFDDGTEFKGQFTFYLIISGIAFQRGRTGRHRQQALVEHANQQIQKAIFHKQLKKELSTGKPDRSWVKDIPKLRLILNAKRERKPQKFKPKPPRCKGKSCKLLSRGQKVRVIKEYPVDITGKRLPGRFRTGDIRWDIEPTEIEKVVIFLDQPPLYQVKGIPNVYYTREQLQLTNDKDLIKEQEAIHEPDLEIIKILGRSNKKGRIIYNVRVKGINKQIEIPRVELIKIEPEMVKEFEALFKLKGGNVFDDFKGTISNQYHKGIRAIRDFFTFTKFNNTSKRNLEAYGSGKVIRIQLYRTPLPALCAILGDNLTQGQFTKAMKHYGYDRFYHLAMIITIDLDGKQYNLVCEKNEEVNIDKEYTTNKDTEVLPVILPQDFNLSLDQMIENTIKSVGQNRFFVYNSFSNNCQRWCVDVLNSNGLLTPSIKEWVHQDLKGFKKMLPKSLRDLAQTAINTKVIFNRLIGKGRE